MCIMLPYKLTIAKISYYPAVFKIFTASKPIKLCLYLKT